MAGAALGATGRKVVGVGLSIEFGVTNMTS